MFTDLAREEVERFITSSGLQPMASEETTAAWVVTDTNPTPVESRSLGEIKAMFH